MSSAEFTVTLSSDIAELIERKLRSGAYTPVSEVIRDGLQALEDREDDLERWLRDHVLPGHAEYAADPMTAIQPERILDRVRARFQGHDV